MTTTTEDVTTITPETFRNKLEYLVETARLDSRPNVGVTIDVLTNQWARLQAAARADEPAGLPMSAQRREEALAMFYRLTSDLTFLLVGTRSNWDHAGLKDVGTADIERANAALGTIRPILGLADG